MLSAPSAADVPAGTDVSITLDLAVVGEAALSTWQDIDDLLGLRPSVRRSVAGLLSQANALVRRLERLTGAVLLVPEGDAANLLDKPPQVVITLNLDLDAAGGVVYSAVVTGGFHGTNRPVDVQQPGAVETRVEAVGLSVDRLNVDGYPVFRVDDTLWTIDPKGRLVVGNHRGLQRQLRAKRNDSQIQNQARRLRRGRPVVVVFDLPPRVRQAWALDLKDFGPALLNLTHGRLSAGVGFLHLQLHSPTPKGQVLVSHAVNAGAALLRGGVALLHSAAHLLLLSDGSRQKSTLVPESLLTVDMERQLSGWLESFELLGTPRRRSRTTTEANYVVSDFRPLVLLGIAVMASTGERLPPRREAQILLRVLRDSQQRYHKKHGRYLTCGPWPRRVPAGPTAWTREACFDKLGFIPPKPTALQLQATLSSSGELLLQAKAKDAAHNNTVQVFQLDMSNDTLRTLSE